MTPRTPATVEIGKWLGSGSFLKKFWLRTRTGRKKQNPAEVDSDTPVPWPPRWEGVNVIELEGDAVKRETTLWRWLNCNVVSGQADSWKLCEQTLQFDFNVLVVGLGLHVCKTSGSSGGLRGVQAGLQPGPPIPMSVKKCNMWTIHNTLETIPSPVGTNG